MSGQERHERDRGRERDGEKETETARGVSEGGRERETGGVTCPCDFILDAHLLTKTSLCWPRGTVKAAPMQAQNSRLCQHDHADCG